jgi:hypothetical protein
VPKRQRLAISRRRSCTARSGNNYAKRYVKMRRLRKLRISKPWLRGVENKCGRPLQRKPGITAVAPVNRAPFGRLDAPARWASRNLDHFAAVEIIEVRDKTDSSVPGTLLTLLVRPLVRQHAHVFPPWAFSGPPLSRMILFCNPMNSGPMRDDQFFTGGALRYSGDSCNIATEGRL